MFLNLYNVQSVTKLNVHFVDFISKSNISLDLIICKHEVLIILITEANEHSITEINLILYLLSS